MTGDRIKSGDGTPRVVLSGRRFPRGPNRGEEVPMEFRIRVETRLDGRILERELRENRQINRRSLHYATPATNPG
jgi:hypothetical protein